MPFCTMCGASVTGAFCTRCGTRVSAASGHQPPPPTPTGAPPAEMPSQVDSGAMHGARKTSPLVWVLVVILGLVIVGGLAIGGAVIFVAHKAREAGITPELWRRNPAAATARVLAAANPDVEIVSEDDGAGTVTVRDRKTGKTMTWNLDQAKHGSLTITAEDGDGKQATVEFGPGSADKLPSWVPLYPGAKAQGAFAVAGNGSEGAGGNFSFTTSDSPERLLSYYQDKVQELGMRVQVKKITPEGGTITATDEDRGRSLYIIVRGGSGETMVKVTYGAQP